jgi:hypothetical protein
MKRDVKYENVNRAIDVINYLSSIGATQDVVRRLGYWRSTPPLANEFEIAKKRTTSIDIIHRLSGFLLIHQAITKDNPELLLLKRLNYVSLSGTILSYSKSLQEKPTRTLQVAVEVWYPIFERARRWHILAHRFGCGLIFYLPTRNKVFSSKW